MKKLRCRLCRFYVPENEYAETELQKKSPACNQCNVSYENKKRKCLRCGKVFYSKGKHNRICCQLKEDMEWLSIWGN